MLDRFWSILGYSAADSEDSSKLGQEVSEYCSRPFPIIIAKKDGLSRLNETKIATEISCHNILFDEDAINRLIDGANRNLSLNSISFINCKFEKGVFSQLKTKIKDNIDISVDGQSEKSKSQRQYRCT